MDKLGQNAIQIEMDVNRTQRKIAFNYDIRAL